MKTNCKSYSAELLLSVIAFLAILFGGCDGGSRGTGSIQVTGKALTTTSDPVPGVLVTDLESGNSDLSDDTGSYSVDAHERDGAVTLGVDAPTFSDTVIVDLAGRTDKLNLNLRVSEEDEEVTGEEFEEGIEEQNEGPESEGSETGNAGD